MFPLFYGTRMELPVMLAAYYGLRRSEVVGLKWSAINFEEKTITISHTFERVHVDEKVIDISKNRTKNESSFRTLPLTPDIEEALLRAKALQEENRKLCGRKYCKKYRDYICVDDLGNLVASNYITQKFKETLLRNNMRPIRFHDLRHPYVKHTTKKYPAKAEIPNYQCLLIVWGFCFCVALVPLFLLKMPVTVWHFHITNSHQGFLIIPGSAD